jgi:hypothetical protein
MDDWMPPSLGPLFEEQKVSEPQWGTQAHMVLQRLREGGGLTPMEAFNYMGITRLAARIDDLRRMGHRIVTHHVTTPTRYGKKATYASYELEDA